MISRAKTYNVACLVRDQEYTLYTCPDNCRAHMNLLYISNGNGGSPTINIEWERADGSHVHILGDKSLTSSEFVQWSGAYVVFEPGDVLKTTASGMNNPHVDVMCTVEEYFLSNRTY